MISDQSPNQHLLGGGGRERVRDGRGIRGKRGREEATERRLYGCPIHDSLKEGSAGYFWSCIFVFFIAH